MDKVKLVNVDNEYKKSSAVNKEDVLKLQEWNEKQPHLPNITELEIILFLHSNYGSVEATKQTIDAYYTCRTHVPEFFGSRDILANDMKIAMELCMITPLSKPTPEGYIVVLCKLINTDYTLFSLADALKLLNFCIDVYFMENGTTAGYVVVLDMSGVTLGHVTRLGLSTIKKFLYYLQEALPVRLKGMHWTNVVPFIDRILMLIKPFMKKQLMEVFHLHSTDDTLYPFVPKECLPIDYGGTAGKSKDVVAEFYEHLKEHREFYLEEERTRRVIESKRPGKPKGSGDIFGIDGNFKKLDID